MFEGAKAPRHHPDRPELLCLGSGKKVNSAAITLDALHCGAKLERLCRAPFHQWKHQTS
jgi:hypothetical protein